MVTTYNHYIPPEKRESFVLSQNKAVWLKRQQHYAVLVSCTLEYQFLQQKTAGSFLTEFIATTEPKDTQRKKKCLAIMFDVSRFIIKFEGVKQLK